MPNININRKTGEIEIEGDCGSEWEGSCTLIKVSKDKITLKCKTELTKECDDMKQKRKRAIGDYDTSNPYEMVQQVLDHGWAQTTTEDYAQEMITILDENIGKNEYFYYEEELDLFRVVPTKDKDELEAQENLIALIQVQGQAVTDNYGLAEMVVDKLQGDDLSAEFETQQDRYVIFLKGAAHTAPGGKAPGGCKKCGPGGEPGKFESSGDIGKKLYEMVGEGGQDDELGDVQDFGWYGLITDTGIKDASHVIVHEDSQGFFDYTSYDTEREARADWAKLESEYGDFMGDEEE